MLDELKAAVNAVIAAAVPHIRIADADEKEPIRRPACQTFVDAGRAERFNADMTYREVTVTIHFLFTDTRIPRREIMQMQDVLSDAFLHGILVQEDLLVCPLEGIEFDVSGGVMTAEFTVGIYEPINDASQNAEPMEVLIHGNYNAEDLNRI